MQQVEKGRQSERREEMMIRDCYYSIVSPGRELTGFVEWEFGFSRLTISERLGTTTCATCLLPTGLWIGF